ncbi:KTSC domain-containing protein [Providencia rettgeri]|uniref:KTSC domain-containing protein n=1 Tax=Providencia rettgeri TaxID=587 RepID=A0A264VR04_PRORE|nr:KTSC domain-containing protein [Providencia rettgeri]OZS73739.1 KTSC domain-containing protein [Providencia rettgeri]RXN73452.1 KTSC domain-containing protein [Providencia rettgeri]
MERMAVSSSNLLSVGYEIETMILEIEFNSGLYQYYDVPEYIYQELINSSSLGRYFNHNIKNNFSFSAI